MKLQTKRTANKIKTYEHEKLTVTVWDERIRDKCYHYHFQNVRAKSYLPIDLLKYTINFLLQLQNIKRKIDNTSPFGSSGNFFEKSKFQNEQRSKKVLTLANNDIINRLNLICHANVIFFHNY